jgi:hypothetical protein
MGEEIMRNARGLFAAVLGLSVIVGCAQRETPEQKADNLATWQVRMAQMSQSLAQLMPLVADPEKFNDPDNRPKIKKEILKFSKLSHDISMNKKPEADPSLDFVSRKFSSDMNEAYAQMERGNASYARYLVQNTTNYCISCHTRTDSGRTNLNFSSSIDMSQFKPLERAEVYMAFRDFDKALEAFDQAAYAKDATMKPQTLELAAEKSLAIAVRVKKDPDLANEMVSRILDSRTAPVFLKLKARHWKQSVKQWQQEEKSKPKKMSPQQMLKSANNLMTRGWRIESEAINSRAGLVEFLRASSLLHDILSDRENIKVYGEALYTAGLVAESLRQINLWTLHEAYYESCIRYSPYTNLAKRCYLRLEALQLSSYSTYDGSEVPRHVRDHLLELRALAEKSTGDFMDWGFID